LRAASTSDRPIAAALSEARLLSLAMRLLVSRRTVSRGEYPRAAPSCGM
jgi:hypothetical protein